MSDEAKVGTAHANAVLHEILHPGTKATQGDDGKWVVEAPYDDGNKKVVIDPPDHIGNPASVMAFLAMVLGVDYRPAVGLVRSPDESGVGGYMAQMELPRETGLVATGLGETPQEALVALALTLYNGGYTGMLPAPG